MRLGEKLRRDGPAVSVVTADRCSAWLTTKRVNGHQAIYPATSEAANPPKFDEPLPFMPNGSLGDSHPVGR